MRLFQRAPDGGKDSGVTGYFLVEMKGLFSIVLLHFNKGSRDAYHSHAFNALTLWLKGHVTEWRLYGKPPYHFVLPSDFKPGMVKYTSRDNMHKVEAKESTWALSIRGPWVDRWQEFKNGRLVTLTNGRKEIT